jgi:hypothetical protein
MAARTRLETAGFRAWVICDGKELPVYRIERSTTDWDGELVEAYISSTSGGRFQVSVQSCWTTTDMVADVQLDGISKAYATGLPR